MFWKLMLWCVDYMYMLCGNPYETSIKFSMCMSLSAELVGFYFGSMVLLGIQSSVG